MNEKLIAKRKHKLISLGHAEVMGWLQKDRKTEAFVSGMLEALRALNAEAELFLVGGSVRDLLEGKRHPRDIDLMLTALTYDELGQMLDSMRESGRFDIKDIISAGKHFPVYKVSVTWFHNPVDVALARTEMSTGNGHRDFQITTHGVQAIEDSERRDFTINAIFFRFFLKAGAIDGELVDYQQGIESLARREIKAVRDPQDRFMEDPLRMLRAIRQKNERHGFVIEEGTWSAICRFMPRLIHTISPERISEELVRSLKANPVQTYLDWKDSGALRELIPELANLSSADHDHMVKKCEYLFYFGRRHEITSAVLLSTLLSEPALRECEEKVRAGSEMLGQGSGSILQDYSEASFYNLRTPDMIARRMFLPNIREIRNILNNFARLIYYKQLKNRRATAEKILSGNPLAPQILMLYRAHRKATLQRKVDFDFLLDKSRAVPRLVSGKDLLDLGFRPGSHMSFILDSIRDRELWDEIKTKDEALQFGKALFQKQFSLYDDHLRRLESLIAESRSTLTGEELISVIAKTFGKEIRELFMADFLRLIELYQERYLLRYTFPELWRLFQTSETEPHYYFRTYYDATMSALRLLLEEEAEVPQAVVLALALLDIGKARPGGSISGDEGCADHALRGAELSEELCRRIGFDDSLCKDVHFIIANHTVFSSHDFEHEIIPLVTRNRDDLIHNLIVVCYYSMRGRFDLTRENRHRLAELRGRIQWLNKHRELWRREYLRGLEAI